jgi:hypothetical protein
VAQLPGGPEWVYEVKLDGYRALAINANGKLSLYSRMRKSLARGLTRRRGAGTQCISDNPVTAFHTGFLEHFPEYVCHILCHVTPPSLATSLGSR